MDKLTMSNVFHTGKRLLLARNLKSLAIKDIANEFNVMGNTVQKWQKEGVPDRSVPTLANYFGVDEWVFTHQGITEEEFKDLILNPKKNGSIRPVFSFEGERRQNGGLVDTNPFGVRAEKLLIRVFVWGVKGKTFSQFALTMNGYYKAKTLERAAHPKPQILRVDTDENTSAKDRVMSEMVVDRIKPQEYFFTIDTPKNFQVFVFELKQYAV
jgi:hypothetical protein